MKMGGPVRHLMTRREERYRATGRVCDEYLETDT